MEGDYIIKQGTDPSAVRDYSDEEGEFLKAIDHYKLNNHRPFPTWYEVLEVLRACGWEKVRPAVTGSVVCVQGAKLREIDNG